MPVSVVVAYDKLKYNLNHLCSELNLSDKRNDLGVIRFCDLILELIAETSSIYREIESAHAARPSNNNNNVKNILPEMISDYSYFSDSQYSLQSRASMRSSRRLRNKPRPSNFNNQVPVSVYNKPPCLSRNYDTIEQAEVEATTKLCDYAFAMTHQAAQQQKQILENEIAYENLKTTTLIERSQLAIDHENKKQKADIAN